MSETNTPARYRLTFNGHFFQSEKTLYNEGETVRFSYGPLATDTDYTFYADSDNVRLKQDYDGSMRYIFTFPMPGHDVKISVKSRNSMAKLPIANPSNHADPASDGMKQTFSQLDTEPWFCPVCGCRNVKRFCSDCGLEKPE